jgi:hypothetical protein
METDLISSAQGLRRQNGDVHKRGTMRLATAADEILPMRDPRCSR